MTKKSLLPETDLARVALLSDDQKRIQLRRVKLGRPSFTYAPVRNAVPAIFNARPELMELPEAKWEDVEAAIKRTCRANGLDDNLAVAKILFEYAKKQDFDAYQWEFKTVATGRGGKIGLWHDFYFIEDGRPVICYIDPRRANGLSTELARDFVFSVMHHNLARGDFSELDFRIFRFSNGDEGARGLETPYRFDPSRLVSEEVINQAIDTTYNIWFEILAEREEAARQNPQTGTGGLFGW